MSKIIEFFKANWQLVISVCGGLLLVVSAVVVVFAFNTRRTHVTPSDEPSKNIVNLIPKAKTYTDLFAVSIDNHVDARPPSGINEAAFVYEMPVEGGITRFLAVFERGLTVAEIGPVRSARPYLLDWISELGPSLFLHFGGSPEALTRIANTPSLFEADHDGAGRSGNSFWRDSKMDAPHNAYTSSTKVEEMFAARSVVNRSVSPWLMTEDPAPEARGKDMTITVPFSSEAAYMPEWRYVSARNVYTRFIKDKEQFDRTKKSIEAKNIIVMKTDVKVLDKVGRVSIATTGSGVATVYRNGETIEATWKNETGGSVTRFYGADGSEVVLTNGNVWIAVVPK